MSQKIYAAITNRVIKALEEGTAPWRKSWNTQAGAVRNAFSQRTYSGYNVLSLNMEMRARGWEDPRFATKNQILQAGGRIRREEFRSPTWAILWRFVDRTNDEGEQVSYGFLKAFRLYNIEQTEGLTLPGIETFEHETILSAQEIWDDWQDRPSLAKGRPAYYPTTDIITIPSMSNFNDPAEYYSTLFHEAAHATGHVKRLAREGVTKSNNFGDHLYAKEELIAEMTSAMLCGIAGIYRDDTESNSAAYLAGWIKAIKGDNKLIVSAASHAQRAADFILGKEKISQSQERDEELTTV